MKQRKRKRLTRAERKATIIETFERATIINRRYMSMYDVAKILNLSPSTYLLRLLDEMVKDGTLKLNIVPHRPQMKKGMYCLPENHIQQRVLIMRDIDDILETVGLS